MAESRDIILPYHWTPRAYQIPLWQYLATGGKRAVCCWHRRSGKDEVALHHLACAAHQRVGNYWYMLPQYGQARKAMWEAINPHSGKRRIDEAFPQEIRRTTREQEMLIVFRNGSTFQLVGSDNFNSLVGSPPIGLVFSEYALSDPSAWGYLRPILLENGGWAIFNSTPRGRNHFHALLTFADTEAGWFAQRLSADETACFTQDALVSELREMQAEQGVDYGYALWLQEYYCSFDAAIPGSIWGDCVKAAEDSGRVVDYPIDPSLPVFTGWDLGRTDDTSIWWFQFNGQGIDVFDHHSSSLKDMPFYFAILEEKRQQHAITYGLHHLPHDARPRTLAAGGKSIFQQCLDAAKVRGTLGTFTIGKRLDKQEHIQAARATFPFCRFHKTRTEKGVNSLRQYHREWDAEKKIFRDTPDHDWCLAGETKLLTRYGTYQIMDLPLTGEVLTSCGWKPYIHPRITRRNAPLVEVVFKGGYTVKCTPEHSFLTANGWSLAQSLNPTSQIQSSLTRSRSILMAVSTVCGPVRNIIRAAARSCIETYGRVRSVLFPRDATSIIEMETMLTIGWPISNACLPLFICRNDRESRMDLANWRESVHLSGIAQKPVGSGIGDIWPASKHGRNGSGFLGHVKSVGSYFRAWCAKVGRLNCIAARNAKWLEVECVNVLNETADVWCLTVPDIEHFSLANGAIVHNSSHDSDAFMELATSWRRPKPGAKPDAPLEDRLLAGNPIMQTMGQMRDAHLSKRKRERQYNWVT